MSTKYLPTLFETKLVTADVLGEAINVHSETKAKKSAIGNAYTRFKAALLEAYKLDSIFNVENYFDITEKVLSASAEAIGDANYPDGWAGQAVVTFKAVQISDLP